MNRTSECVCVTNREAKRKKEQDREMETEKEARDGQNALPRVSLCARLYSDFIRVMQCDSIVPGRSSELVFPPTPPR